MQEYYRLKSSLRAKKEHASLLDDFKEFDRTRLDLEEGGGSEQQTLLKEYASISRSTGQVGGTKQVFVIMILPVVYFAYYTWWDIFPIKKNE